MSDLIDRIHSDKFVLIAEIGVNYYDIAKKYGISNMDAAKMMCEEAKNAGVHAVKFQSYTAENLAAKDSPSYWDTNEEPTTSQRELFAKYDSFGKDEYVELARFCDDIGIEFCSTAFDFYSADYLEPLMPLYKVSSSDLNNLPFIEYQAKKGKPMIVSVGAGDLSEMREALGTIRKHNDQTVVLCHCVLEYPTPYNHANLSRISSLRKEFPDLKIGYSDHCKPDDSYDVVKTAYVLGARVIEKHFTLDKKIPGNDHYHAMDPLDAKAIIEGISHIETLMGKGDLGFSENEMAARMNARRSIVSNCDIPSNVVINEDMLTFKRPGKGIAPSRIDEVIGRRSVVDIPEDTLLDFGMLA